MWHISFFASAGKRLKAHSVKFRFTEGISPGDWFPIVKLNCLSIPRGTYSAIALLFVVFYFATPAQAATTTIPILIQDTASTTSLFTVVGLPANVACIYQFGFGNHVPGTNPTGGVGGTCNTVDFLVGDNSVRMDPVFGSVLNGIQSSHWGWVKIGLDYYVIEAGWSGTRWSDTGYGANLNFDPFVYDFGFQRGYNTRFIDLDVNPVSPTGTVRVRSDQFVDPTEVDINNPLYNPTKIKFTLNKIGSTTNVINTVNVNDFSTTTYSTFYQLDDGQYRVLVQFSNQGCQFGISECPFPLVSALVGFTVSNNGATISQRKFEYYDGTEPVATDGYVYQTCSLTQLSNCINNSFAFLFIPSSQTLNLVGDISDSLSTKFPFAYLYDFQQVLSELFSSPLSQSAEVTVPFGTYGNITLMSSSLLADVPFAPLIKTLLGWSLWLMFAMHMYRRTLVFFNREQVVTL